MAEPIRILVVDDEPIACSRLKTALEKHGYAVHTCGGGAEALESLRTGQFRVIVTDVRMDGIDGLQILDVVRKNYPEIAAILTTGYASVEVAREALAKGAFDIIAKPFRPKDLRAIIEQALKVSRRAPD
jgi:DNA-binding NtrC family response regulator